jgi:hypothetical protein
MSTPTTEKQGSIMKTYTVLFAEDVPHYGTVEIEAENDVAALDVAKAYDLSEVTIDPMWECSVSKRIVHIEDAEGNTMFHDVHLDNYALCLETERAEMLEALELCEDVLSDLARLDDGTPSTSALNMVRGILAKAKRGQK